MTSEAFGRELLQVVEIDLDRCTRVYGSAPCAAALGTTGVRKCFNTRFTCQDPANYAQEAQTFRFSRDQGGLPKGTTVFPAVQDVSTRAGEVNLSGIDERRGPLGARAEVQITLADFTYSDLETDPYRAGRIDGTAQTDEGGYDPAERGTFFGKLRARNPYLVGRAVRVREGYAGEAFGDMRTRNYVVTEWNGPDGRGRVTIKARDILDLAENKKAVAPQPSRGRLAADLEDDATTFTMLGEPTEYEASGRVCIGNEIIRYTRSGATFTAVERGADGTEAASHRRFDTIQQCLRFEKKPPYEIARDLLVDHAAVDPAYIDFAAWQAEGKRWQAGYRLTATIPRPIGVTTLLSELAFFGVMWWWDEVAQEIRFRVNRPLDIGESYIPLTDAPAPDLADPAHISAESADVEYDEASRVSTVMLWHGMLNAAGGEGDPANFARLSVATDPTQASPEKYGQERVRTFYTRWLGQAGSENIAAPVIGRLLNRYRNSPRIVAATIDAKDAGRIELATLVELTARVAPDATGAKAAAPMQVKYVEEVVGGHAVKIRAETFTFTGRYGFITNTARPDYDDSSAAEIAKGTYIVDEATMKFSDGSGPYQMF